MTSMFTLHFFARRTNSIKSSLRSSKFQAKIVCLGIAEANLATKRFNNSKLYDYTYTSVNYNCMRRINRIYYIL